MYSNLKGEEHFHREKLIVTCRRQKLFLAKRQSATMICIFPVRNAWTNESVLVKPGLCGVPSDTGAGKGVAVKCLPLVWAGHAFCFIVLVV